MTKEAIHTMVRRELARKIRNGVVDAEFLELTNIVNQFHAIDLLERVLASLTEIAEAVTHTG